STFIYDAGPLVIGARVSSTTLPGLSSHDNTLVVKSGALFQCGLTSRRSLDIGDANFFGQSGTIPYPATNNSLTIEFGGSVTQASIINISPTNGVNQLGGYLDCTVITNWGTINAWGANRGGIVANNGSTVRILTSQGRYSLTNSLILSN